MLNAMLIAIDFDAIIFMCYDDAESSKRCEIYDG